MAEIDRHPALTLASGDFPVSVVLRLGPMDIPDNRGKGAATVFAIVGTVGHLALLILTGIAAAALGGRQLWDMVQEAGWFIWILLPGSILAMLLMVAVGVWFARRPDSWSWVPIIFPATLMLVAVAGVFYSMRNVENAIDGASVDPSLRATILAQGIAESLNLTFFGGLLAMMLAGSAATVLTARALARVGKKRVGTASGVALLLGMLSLIIVTLARFAWPPLGFALPFGIFPSLVGIVAVTVASLSLTGPRVGLDNPAGALGDSIVAALCAIAGVGFASLAVRTQLVSHAFAAVDALPLADRHRVLSTGWTEASQAALAHLLFAAPVALAMLGPLSTRLVYLGRALMRTGGGVVGVLLAGGIAVGIPFVQIHRLGATLARLSDFSVPSDVTLPETGHPERLSSPRLAPWVWVGRDVVSVEGHQVVKAPELDNDAGCAAVRAALADRIGAGGHPINLGIDTATPYRRLACVAAALRDAASFGLAMDAAKKPDTRVAAPFDQVRGAPGIIEVLYVDASKWAPPRLHVHLSPGAAMIRAGQATDGRTIRGTDAEVLSWLEAQANKAQEVTFTADPATPAAFLIAATTRVHPGHVVRIGPAVSADRAFDLGVTPPPPTASASSSVAAPDSPPPSNELDIAGPLSADAIKRVVIQHRSKLRACYEQGLKKNPELQGKVTVAFTIAPSGRVAVSKMAESSLHDAQVEQCIVQAFATMVFPKPTGGDVKVSYPVVFAADR